MQRIPSRCALVLGVSALLGGLTAATATTATADDAGNYRFINNASGGSLMPQDHGNNSSDGIVMYAWHDYDTQGGDQWNLDHTPSGYYLIRNIKTGKCLKPGREFHMKLSVTQGACNDTYEFHWSFNRNSSGDQYKITSRSANKVLAPYFGKESGEVVVLESDSNIAKNWWSATQV